jgi:thiamine pyrophosphokinase
LTTPGRSFDAVVVSGGGAPSAETVASVLPVPAGVFVVAADSGLDHALGLGLRVDVVVGDLDSVSAAGLEAAAASGTAVERHPEAKDATDLELALDVAVARGARRILVLGPGGGRFDHVLAGAALLAAPRYAAVDIEARLGPARLVVVRSSATLTGRPGELVTLLPVHGAVAGVVTEGLLYPLRGEDLLPGSTRGVSNEMLGDEARVSVRAGVLVAIQPGALGTHLSRRG